MGLFPGARLGPVVIESFLGAGWEGSVYRVRRTGTSRLGVLKCYRPRPGVHAAVASRVRLLQRARACAVLPRVERQLRLVHEGAEWPALLMGYAPGQPLESFPIRRQGRLSLPVARAVLAAVLRALAALHARGAYHGDLHEGNILLHRCGGGFRAHLVDPFPQPGSVRALQEGDLVEAVRLFARLLGGAPRYAGQPAWVKQVCAGLQARRIVARFPSVTSLQAYLRKTPARGRAGTLRR